jgi:C-terminal processing protease CtpA/Prc
MENSNDLKRYCGVGFGYGQPIFDDKQKVIGYSVSLIRSPFETPAMRAGIQDGDVILAVDPTIAERGCLQIVSNAILCLRGLPIRRLGCVSSNKQPSL